MAKRDLTNSLAELYKACMVWKTSRHVSGYTSFIQNFVYFIQFNMSNRVEREAEDAYEAENDASPVTGTVMDNSYVAETNPALRDTVPVQPDEQQVEDPMQPPYSNSDQQLGKSLSSPLLFEILELTVTQNKMKEKQ